MYKPRTLGSQKQHTFLPHDFTLICVLPHDSGQRSGLCEHQRAHRYPRRDTGGQSYRERVEQLLWFTCLRQWGCGCGLFLCLHTCSYTYTGLHPFSYSEKFPYQDDDSKYEKQTSVYNLMCATSSPFTTCQYSLRVVLLSSEGKQLKRNLKG